jgi:hypothetical protein
MTELHQALTDISSIRRQMARTAEFRGYGPATLASTAVLAVAAAFAQMRFVPHPARHPIDYLAVWLSTAILSGALIAIQTGTRTRRMHSGMANEMILQAVEQFLPAAAAGALLTCVLVRHAPEAVWMLPGLWQIVFALGVFASCRFLPRPMMAAGAWYLLTGLISIGRGDERAMNPWTMGLAFGVGQLLVAAILLATSGEAADEA